MKNSILPGQYVSTDSVLHRLDPRTKLIALLVLMLSFLMMDTLLGYAVAAMFVLLTLLVSKIQLGRLFSGLKPILLILLFTLLYHALLSSGSTVLWTWSFIRITSEGVLLGIFVVWRIMLMILLASLLTLTTQPLILAQGLERLLSPLSRLKVPVEQFALMIVIAIRFIPTIVQELDRILLAQKARGYDIAAVRWPRRMFAYIPVLVPLFMTTIQRAEQLTQAIDARAYGDGKGRTMYRQLVFRQRDLWVGGVAVGVALMLALL